jgi:hypothetical protein
MDETGFATAWREGIAMVREEVLDYALADRQSNTEPQPTDILAPSVLRREGEYWTVVFETHTFRLKDTKGVRYLSHLLQNPGREFHVLNLAALGHGAAGGPSPTPPAQDDGLHETLLSDAGSVLDERAKTSYRTRLRELENDLNEATAWSDSLRASKIREEMDFLSDELAAAMGLGGRDRRAGSQAERARVNITRAVMTRIRGHSAALGNHLDATIHTGTFCSYSPDPRTPITWQV